MIPPRNSTYSVDYTTTLSLSVESPSQRGSKIEKKIIQLTRAKADSSQKWIGF